MIYDGKSREIPPFDEEEHAEMLDRMLTHFMLGKQSRPHERGRAWEIVQELKRIFQGSPDPKMN